MTDSAQVAVTAFQRAVNQHRKKTKKTKQKHSQWAENEFLWSPNKALLLKEITQQFFILQNFRYFRVSAT